MKQFLLIAAFAMFYGEGCLLYAQAPDHGRTTSDTTLRWLFRVYEDDDFINIRGRGTDNAYTNGTRLDYFYQPQQSPKGIINKVMPKTGANSVNIYGWGIMQLMYTPNNISDSAYQPNDYPWSGALVATHTLYSYNPVKKYDFQTELELGVIGPAALDRQAQTMVHHMIRYLKPMGWRHQYRNDVLANINFTSERQFAGNGFSAEFIGGGQVSAGTMMNSLTLYPMLRLGKMNPYFQGFIRQFTGAGTNTRHKKRTQFYFICRPEVQFILSEAVLQGGMFTSNPNLAENAGPAKTQQQSSGQQHPYHPIHNIVWSSNFGAVATIGNFSISFNQNSSTAMMKGLYSHEVGNISLYFGW
jgi:lipid A 3-O-deacylase